MRTVNVTAILLALALLAGCAAEEPDPDSEPVPDETTETEDGADEGTDEGTEDGADEGTDEGTDEEASQDDAGETADGDAVTIVDFSFDPDTITVEVGDTVVWTNEDSARHNVAADDDSFASDNLAEGETFSHTFEEAGTFDYVCTLHGGMTATVEVG